MKLIFKSVSKGGSQTGRAKPERPGGISVEANKGGKLKTGQASEDFRLAFQRAENLNARDERHRLQLLSLS